MLRAVRLLAAASALVAATATSGLAQDSVALQANVLFYGDNTEFRNPFREGETIFGAAVRLAAVAGIGDRTILALGAFGNLRFGSEKGFDLARPVVSITIRGARSSITFGTLPPSPHASATGPDLNGPHGLLPPLQRETLAFDRPYEAGLQWLFAGRRLRQDAWLNWQRVNTRDHRERFDAGVNGWFGLTGPFTIPYQVHIVHEGGQLFRSGPVADSQSAAAGVSLRGRLGALEAIQIDAFGTATRFVPDRASPERHQNGAGFLGRASVERAGWRAHLLVWRGWDFITDEGDPNYLSIRRDGSRYRGTRDYSEVGLTRLFRLVPGVTIHASGRVHRIEKHYEYSYRVLAVVGAEWKVR
jgi:hypothetical protein